MHSLRDDMFPSSRWQFFRVLLAFSDGTDFARILLFMLELGARVPVFLTMQVDPAVQVQGSSESQRAAAAYASGEMDG